MAKVTIADKAKKAGLPVQVVYNRMHAGWTEKKALSVPKQQYKKRKVAYKVEPKKVLTPRSTVKPVEKKVPPTVPLPVEKYEAPKSNTFIYLAVVLVGVLIFAIMST
ncbi:hypothetical protein OAA02_00325 [bacterium]|jgi:hypothetical protein|nr:hypothetical protein [bacterium]